MMSHVCRLITAFAAAAISVSAIASDGESYPAKPLRMIVPFPPGGSTDVIGRLVSGKLAEKLKRPVIVENRAGVAGTLGSEAVAKAAPDGYTLLLGTNATHAISIALYSNLPYHPLRDFTPIGLVARSPSVLVVHPSLPVKSVADLVDYAKKNPGRLTFGSAGNGSSAQLCAEMFKTAAGVDMLHVPYKGGAPAVTDLLGGQISLMFAGLPETMPHVRAGKLRALGVTSASRTPADPALPTIAEAGLANYEFNQWFGVLAPAGTSNHVVERVNTALVEIMVMPDVRDRLLSQGMESLSSTPAEFGAYMAAEIEKMVRVVKAAGVQIDK